MATEISPLVDDLKTYRLKYNGLVAEVNGISSISSITTNSGAISLSSGQKNIGIGIYGSNNISTIASDDGSGPRVTVSLSNSITISSLSASGNSFLNGASNTINGVSISNLTVGSGGGEYSFPTSGGSEGEALVFNASGDLVAGTSGLGANTFFELTDTPASGTGLGSRVPFFNGAAGGDATSITTDSTFIFDSTNDFLIISKLRIGEGIDPTDTTPIRIEKSYTSASSPAYTVFFESSFDTNSAPDGPGNTVNGIRNTTTSVSTLIDEVKGITNETNISAGTSSVYGIDNFVTISGASTALGDLYAQRTTCTLGANPSTNTLTGFLLDVNALGDVTADFTNLDVYTRASGTVGGTIYGICQRSDGSTPVDYGIHAEDIIKTQSAYEFNDSATADFVPVSGKIFFYTNGSRIGFSYFDGGTTRYKYLDLSGTGTTWQHSTSPF